MKKNWMKIVLDVIVLFLLIFMFNKRIFGQAFHEIGGLVLCGLLLIHLALNMRNVITVGKKFFSRALPKRVKINFILSLLLFIGFAWIALSGIMISKEIFTSISGEGRFWKVWHYFISAWVVVVAGIHLGLNWNFVKQMLKKRVHIPEKFHRLLTVLAVVCIFISGGYSMVTSEFAKWLGGPFLFAEMEKGDRPDFRNQDGKFGGFEMKPGREMPADFQKGERPDRPDGLKEGDFRGKGKGANFSMPELAKLIFNYGSILLLFSVLTQFFLRFKKRKINV